VSAHDPKNSGQPIELDRVPRSPAEEEQLLAVRQDLWEFLLFAAVLRRKTDDLEPEWRAHEAHERRPAADELSDVEARDRLLHVFERPRKTLEAVSRQMAPEAQERAFGKPGEAGDPQLITDFAAGLVAFYRDLLDWSAQLRGSGVPQRFRAVYDLTSEFVDPPIRQFREYVARVVAELDRLPTALREGQPIDLALILKLSVDPEFQERARIELDRITAGYQRESATLEAQTTALQARTALAFFKERRAKKAFAATNQALARLGDGQLGVDFGRKPIPEQVRHEIWRRDQGRCVDCGSRERLEFDHIIPVSRGGANTVRNLELRCESCNRRKGASI
jgi:HNH endonuclease